MKEIWKDVIGWEGLYQVSNLGNVRTLHYKKPYPRKLSKSKKGYLRVNLSQNKKYKYYSVHRLVAEAFIPNPNNLPQINHKDENRTNNRVDNLEWCTNKYNCNYGHHCENVGKSRKGKKPTSSHVENIRKSHALVQGKKVNQYLPDGTFVRSYDSMGEAARSLNTYTSYISLYCLGKRKKLVKGYKFEYGNQWYIV